MIKVRRARDRGHADHGWLDTRHTFSFADYYDPEQMGFRSLRVLNEDRVSPGAGFGTHGHREMEILSYVVQGSLAHRDSLGNGSVLRAGDVQRMTAGTGVRHSEKNPSGEEPVHFLQVWIEPARRGLPPSYEERHFSERDKRGRLCRIASPDGDGQSLKLHQDAEVYAALLGPAQQVEHALASGRHAWVQVVRGEVSLNDRVLEAGDGAAVSDEPKLSLGGRAMSELLLFDLA